MSIYVYSIDECNQATCTCVQRSVKQYPCMNVNLYENHFSFINDIQSYIYSNCFVCTKCDKIFPKPYALSRHEKTCNTNVKHKFPGKVFQIPKTVLRNYKTWVSVESDDNCIFPLFCYVGPGEFSISCYSESNAALQWTAEHVPASISIASNVPGYESAHCFVTYGHSKNLV